MGELRQLLVMEGPLWDDLVDHYNRKGVDLVRVEFDDPEDEDYPTYVPTARTADPLEDHLRQLFDAVEPAVTEWLRKEGYRDGLDSGPGAPGEG